MSFLNRFQIDLESFSTQNKQSQYVVAYSGGVDSHVLLQCCVALDLPVRAVHIHHGLQTVADYWVGHCQAVCKNFNVELKVVYIDATKQRRESPEESARKARYKALQSCLKKGDCLLLGQHMNDQAETLLLQLFRASGAAGLAAMPIQRKVGDNIQLRPLLSFSRSDIVAYAEENSLSWIEDPSNRDTSFDRNFIRTKLLPLLENRWPEIAVKLSAATQLQANNLLVMEDMAAIDLANVIQLQPDLSVFRFYPVISVLSISKLKQLSSARLLNVFRFWITEALDSSVLSTRNLLEELEHCFVNTEQDTKAAISFSGYEFRKYQDYLFLLKPLLSKNTMTETCDSQLIWNPSQELEINSLGIKLERVQKLGIGTKSCAESELDTETLKMDLFDKNLSVRFRQGGETFHPAKRRHSQRLKKLLQEENIFPWERDIIPLIYLDEELVAIAGLWVSKKYVALNNNGWYVKISSI